MSDSKETRREPTGMEIAIVGMAGRFPGARDLDEYWENLRQGREAIRLLTDQELDELGVPASLYRQPNYVRAVRSLDEIEMFDAGFFEVPPREAELIDPQHRIFLELSWQALEDAGYDPDRCPGQVGVFAGGRMNSYMLHFLAEMLTQAGIQIQVANDKDYLATRVSYKLDLGGPSVNVQTACSTSLVALHLACQSLIAGECDLALAGGASIRTMEQGYPYRDGDVVSPDGRIRPFDAQARGTIFGNGVGVVLVKRLEDALADGDPVRAVVLGSAVTNDGSRKVGFTAPGVDGQARAVRAALTVAEVHPDTISYVEAHGTGTPLGDPIEVRALTEVYREHTERTGYCGIGSVKSNLGHLSSAAGVASLIKTVLAMEHGEIPPSINFETTNPEIDFASSPFRVLAELTPWPHGAVPRRAAVSAFGMGGTNAHVILEEAPAAEPSGPSAPWQLLPLSARSPAALDELTKRLAARLERGPSLPLADVSFTLEAGRRVHEHRRTVVAETAEDAVRVLRELPRERIATGRAAAKASVAFLFPGQGAQHPNMSRQLYEDEPVYRAELDRVIDLLAPHVGVDLRGLLFPEPGAEEAAALRLAETAVTQPALFAVEHALARLWMAKGVEPQAMLGHSIGEYVAATLAGVFALEEAARLVAARGRLMQELPAGSMLSVPLPEEELADLLPPELSVAVVNAPGRSVVSGPTPEIEALATRLAGRGVQARTLRTSHAFHSPMMEPILSPFLECFRGIELKEPRIPFVSNVTGTWIRPEEATDPGYWARHLRQAVRFADGVGRLFEDLERVLLEVGPGRTLQQLARRHPDGRGTDGRGRTVAATLPHPKDGERVAEAASLLTALGELWTAGVPVDLSLLHQGEHRRRVPLPTYPFERRRYWVEPTQLMEGRPAGPPKKKGDLAEWFYLPAWKPRTPPLPPSENDLAGAWLLFVDETGLGDRLAARLEAVGAEVATVRSGRGFERTGERSFVLAPAERRGYADLLAALGEPPTRVVHLWNVTGESPADDVEQHADTAFWSLLWLGQALGKVAAQAGGPVSLAAVSDCALRVSGEAAPHPGKATMIGPVEVLPREHPEVRTVAVDLGDGGPGGGLDELVDVLLAEAVTVGPEPAIAAYRVDAATGAPVRWLRGFEPSPLQSPADDQLRVKPGGTYLVTGGLGGIGLAVARWLAESSGARLVLTSRSGLPPREEWDAVTDAATKQRIEQVRGLEAAGAQVLVVAADVTDREAMARVVGQARSRFGGIDGVIHAAGLPGAGVIQLKTEEAARSVLAPKVVGTVVLDRVLADDPPDWTLLCSSTIAILGGAGQVDYCAANNFLDAWAASKARAGGPVTLSINWGAWEEVGMAAAAGITRAGGYGTVAPSQEVPLEETGEPFPHLLLARCRREPDGGAVFSTDVSPESHWIADEHRILGTPTLPGTSHVEIAAAACRQLTGAAAVTLSDVFFFSPLMVEEGASRRLEAHLTPDGDGFRFSVKSRSAGGAWQEHARGRVAAAEVTVESRDLGAVRSRLEEAPKPDPAAVEGSKKVVSWGAHWQSLERVWLGDGEGLARLELPEAFAAEVADFTLHPALLDVATGIASALHGESYLPLSYGRVEVRGTLPARFWSHLQQAGEPGARETILVDLSLVDDQGFEIVRIERFAMKRVGEAASKLARPAAPERPGVAVDAGSDGILPREGIEAFRRVLYRGFRMPQVAVSAKDLSALRKIVAEASLGRGKTKREERPAHERPELASDYVAPRNETEERLALIWAQGLGIDRVGVHDNFFDLGGDSVIGIQIVSQAQEAGIRLAPDQLFEYQTIAELAAAAAAEPAAPAPAAEEVDGGVSEDELAKVMAKLGELE